MQTYMEALEEERRKILVFQRELPLCLELVTQAIETCKQQLSGTTCEYNIHGGQSECNSEQTSTEGPVLEEFIPIKRSRSEDTEQEQEDENNNEQYSREHPRNSTCCSSKKNTSEKSDWLRSAQLWNNQTPDLSSKNVNAPKRVSVVEVKRNGGAFQPFHRDKSNPTTNINTDTKCGVEKSSQSLDKDSKPQSSVHTAATSSTAETVTSSGDGEGGSNKRDEKAGQPQRKQRRCWSPELHRRFLQALQQLGGSHAATPKQIRELMKVDGLTNDEVKSHLQKYRLHTRRPSPTIHQNANPPPPQFVVVGGIWVPPHEYAAVTGNTTSVEAAKANGIYAPVAAPSAAVPQTSSVTQQPNPKQSEPSHSEGRDSHSAGHVRCNSPSTSSSTHTSTASPVY